MNYREATKTLDNEIKTYRSSNIKGTFTEVLEAHEEVLEAFESCRNNLCLKCGRYENAHEGACDKCRWR